MIKLAFVGAGRMARAMVKGILEKGELRPENIGCLSGSGKTARQLAMETGIHFEPDLKTLVSEADATVLACKPHQVESLDPAMADYTAGKCLISVLAGISLNKLFHLFPMVDNIIRAMPNTPGAIGHGVTGYACLKAPEPQTQKVLRQVLEPAGMAIAVEERMIDGVTGISGSGVAFAYAFIRALSRGGQIQGLPEADANRFAMQTVLGAAKLMAHTGKNPQALIDEVVSKGGTTEAGLNVMEAEGFDAIVHDAVAAAAHRSRELAEQHS